MAMYDSSNTVEKSFDLDYISESLLQAQWSEFIELKKVIHDVFLKKGAPSRILDIGVGNARVPLHLAGIKEIWDMIERYHGTDNALACVEIAQENARNARIANKLSIQLLDATQLAELASEYDLIACTWFTPGNFYPDEFSFSSYKAGIAMPDLSHNEKFELVFGTAYKLLKAGGTLLLGACYLDNDATRLKQEESYLKMGMNIITGPAESFTATKEGFWSQRFTSKRLLDYLHFAAPEKISITPLDTYDYAIQVRIEK